MDEEVAKYMKEYPNLDELMVKTILGMSEEEHIKFQEGLESGKMCDAPDKLIIEDGIKIINSSEAEGQTDV